MITLFLVVGGVVGIGLLIYGIIAVAEWEQRKYWHRFEEQWPPISDEEFVELCGPSTDPEIALKVRRIIARNLGVEYDRVHPAMSFQEDLGAD